MDQQADLFKLPVTEASDRKLQIGIFVCPGLCVVDIIGLQAIFGLLPNADVHLVWKNKEMIVGWPTFPTHATTTFEECPRHLDVLLIGAVPLRSARALRRHPGARRRDRGSQPHHRGPGHRQLRDRPAPARRSRGARGRARGRATDRVRPAPALRSRQPGARRPRARGARYAPASRCWTRRARPCSASPAASRRRASP